MSTYLDAIRKQVQAHPLTCAFYNTAGETLTYQQLWDKSDALACWLVHHGHTNTPVCLYGHKQALMVIGMIACMKAGVAYVPLDSSFPPSRIEAILAQLDNPCMCCAEELPSTQLQSAGHIIMPGQLEQICMQRADIAQRSALTPVTGDDAIYLLFTSGSTGTPKGVVQRAESVDLTSRYFSSLAPQSNHLVCFNRAPFSFDLSIFDLLIALPGGHTLFALDKETEASLARSFEAFHKANIGLWVSTPSFLAMCLTDPAFNRNLLPNLKCVMVCGETLSTACAKRFIERFGSTIPLINFYGPSETCGAVTDVTITPEMTASSESLPVGTPSPYSSIVIADPETLEEVPVGAPGEILILGDTAARGYYRSPEKTASAFSMRVNHKGTPCRCYRSGDEGWLDKDGMLHFIGRLDLQIKMNGYRIELGDIEENLNSLAEVSASCVAPITRNGTYTALAAHIVPAPEAEPGRPLTKILKAKLGELLPAYMIPRTFTYYSQLPTTINGKIDRKTLQTSSNTSHRTHHATTATIHAVKGGE